MTTTTDSPLIILAQVYGRLPHSIGPTSMNEYTGDEEEATGPPENVDAPYLSGTAMVGETLTSTMGNWTNVPDDYKYAWYRDGTVISGETSESYVLGDADVGKVITAVVTATNSFGTADSPQSNGVGPVETPAESEESQPGQQPSRRPPYPGRRR
jgi:hypothetical protein